MVVWRLPPLPFPAGDPGCCSPDAHPRPPPLQGTPADVLYKGTISRIMGEDGPSRLDRAREDPLPKGHVIYEGKKGHVLSYEGKCWAGAMGPLETLAGRPQPPLPIHR